MKKTEAFQQNIGYKFNNISFLRTALTHSSFLNESSNKSHNKCNERMEFLGDSILGLSVANYLFKEYPDYPEGKMSKLRALVVCENTLSDIAEKFGLGDFIYMSNGEELTGGRKRKSILSDAMESVIAAVFLDSSFEVAESFVLSFIIPYINDAVSGKLRNTDFKTALQEKCQALSKKVSYKLISETGPDHMKVFESAVYIDDIQIASGEGKSKRESEQNAACKCIAYLEGKNGAH